MKVRLFYQSVSKKRPVGNRFFLRSFIEEVAYRNVETDLIEYKPKKDKYKITRFIRRDQKIVFNTFETNYQFFSEKADLIIIELKLPVETINRICDHYLTYDRPVILLHDPDGELVFNPLKINEINISLFDGVIAGSSLVKACYEQYFEPLNITVLREAVNSRCFFPKGMPFRKREHSLAFVGNASEERIEQLKDFFVQPVKDLKIKAGVAGKGYPESFKRDLRKAGIQVHGWLRPEELCEALSFYGASMVLPPEKSLRDQLPMQLIESVACAVPVISTFDAAAQDLYNLPEFIRVGSSDQVEMSLVNLFNDHAKTFAMVNSGLRAINKSFTCWHRVNQLFGFLGQIKVPENRPRLVAR